MATISKHLYTYSNIFPRHLYISLHTHTIQSINFSQKYKIHLQIFIKHFWIYFKNPQIGVHIYNPILPKKVPIQRQIDWRYFQTVSYALLIQRQIDWRHLQTMLQELDIHFLIDIIYSRMQMHTQQLVRQFSRLLKTYRRHPQNFLKIMAHTFPMQKKILLKHFHIIFIMYMIA